jgi:signal transduction histidine kinase
LSRFDLAVDVFARARLYAHAVFRPWPSRKDLFLALLVVAIAGLEIRLNPGVRPRWAAAVTELPAGLALAWRRRFPLATVAAVSVATGVEVVLRVPVDQPIVPLAAEVVSLYSLALASTFARATAGIGIWAATLVALGLARHPGSLSIKVGNIAFGLVIAGAAWTAGRAVRTRTEHASEHALRADRLEAERATVVAQERARIARELHDVIAHSVSVMVVQAAAATEMLKHDPERASQPLAAVEETGRQALVEMGRLVGLLREGEHFGLAPQPGLDDLDALAAQVTEAGLPVEVRIEGARRPVPLGIDLSAYRVIQEALTNALKHAGRARAHVLLRFETDALEVEVVDDGSGGAPMHSGGHGLIGMRERVSVFGGEFHAGPRPGGGYTVRARMPFGSATA